MTMDDVLFAQVDALIREIAAREILPRYRTLQQHDIAEKAPGDIVTVADHAVEAALASGLAALLPAARFIGEERCAQTPALIDTLGDGLAWIVDPIDGTANFAGGRPPFAVMVALLLDGVTIASWIYDPLDGIMTAARQGMATWCDGHRIDTGGRDDDAGCWTGIVSRFAMPDGMAPAVTALEAAIGTIVPTKRCAGHEYVLVAQGKRDFALFWRTLAWDHVPGALLLVEAGGVVERLDGTPYRPGSTEPGLLLARDRRIADHVRMLLRRPDDIAG
jgi:fructose-1,6-bisphosphatase/inositol monophosphatase family enzyme